MTSSGRSNSTATSVGDNPTTSQSDHSPPNTQVSSEVNKAHTEISPPYSDKNSPIMQHPQEAQQQLESFGHLRISKEGTRPQDSSLPLVCRQKTEDISSTSWNVFKEECQRRAYYCL
ncbi:hypothetical protein E4T45_09946 [Aureobasidium sp. EXF-8846]|nr:hypothetical protein E4T45_09946 [Aureobasidium sp. EXF-8846]